jgi:anthranilate phosphoribosyltransferase
MTTEIRNWAVVAAAMEAKGETNSEIYRRAKALAEGQDDPVPTSDPAAPFSITTA